MEDKRKEGTLGSKIIHYVTTSVMQWTISLVNIYFFYFLAVSPPLILATSTSCWPWADISFSCVLDSVLVCEQFRRNSKTKEMCCCKCFILYRIILHLLLPFPLVFSHVFFFNQHFLLFLIMDCSYQIISVRLSFLFEQSFFSSYKAAFSHMVKFSKSFFLC